VDRQGYEAEERIAQIPRSPRTPPRGSGPAGSRTQM